MQNFTKEFRDFIDRGNVLALAVAVVLGAAFAPIIDAIVTGLLTPIIAAIFGQPDFSGLSITLRGEGIDKTVISYGIIIEAILNFVFIALALFVFVVKPWNAYQARTATEEESDDGPSETDLLAEIRDVLRDR